MISQISIRFCRLALFAGFVALSALASSCARRLVVSVPKPPVAPTGHAAPAPHLAPRRVGPLPPLAFPDLDTNQISDLKFSPDGRRLAFGYGADAGVSMWNLETGKLSWQRHVNASDGGALQFGPGGKFLIAQFGDPDGDTPIIALRHRRSSYSAASQFYGQRKYTA